MYVEGGDQKLGGIHAHKKGEVVNYTTCTHTPAVWREEVTPTGGAVHM